MNLQVERLYQAQIKRNVPANTKTIHHAVPVQGFRIESPVCVGLAYRPDRNLYIPAQVKVFSNQYFTQPRQWKNFIGYIHIDTSNSASKERLSHQGFAIPGISLYNATELISKPIPAFLPVSASGAITFSPGPARSAKFHPQIKAILLIIPYLSEAVDAPIRLIQPFSGSRAGKTQSNYIALLLFFHALPVRACKKIQARFYAPDKKVPFSSILFF